MKITTLLVGVIMTVALSEIATARGEANDWLEENVNGISISGCFASAGACEGTENEILSCKTFSDNTDIRRNVSCSAAANKLSGELMVRCSSGTPRTKSIHKTCLAKYPNNLNLEVYALPKSPSEEENPAQQN